MAAVTRACLGAAINRKVGLPRSECVALVDAVLDTISGRLTAGEPVKLQSFGSFTVRDKAERMGRNPKTGETCPVSARRVVVFRPSQGAEEPDRRGACALRREAVTDAQGPSASTTSQSRIGDIREATGLLPGAPWDSRVPARATRPPSPVSATGSSTSPPEAARGRTRGRHFGSDARVETAGPCLLLGFGESLGIQSAGDGGRRAAFTEQAFVDVTDQASPCRTSAPRFPCAGLVS